MAHAAAIAVLLMVATTSCGARVGLDSASDDASARADTLSSEVGAATDSAVRDVAVDPSGGPLVCNEFRYYECDTRCFKVEPLSGRPDCAGSAGCGDIIGHVTFVQGGRITQGDAEIATFTTEGGKLATVTRNGVTTKCVLADPN